MEQARFIDQSSRPPTSGMWQSIVVKREQIAEVVERLMALPKPAEGGRRRSLIVHPEAVEPGLGFAPATTVAIEVLLPGEATRPERENTSQIVFCVAGSGRATVGSRVIEYAQRDVWNVPSMATYAHENTGSVPLIRFVFSNQALLERLGIYYLDRNPPEAGPSRSNSAPAGNTPFSTIPVNEDGAALLPYEMLIRPKVRLSPALHWPWKRVRVELDALGRLGKEYDGRRLFQLYNPATEGLNGSNRSFSSYMALLPAGQIDIPHRHSTAAINYYFEGSGHSIVNGKEDFWGPGDLHLSAPGWAVHHHMSFGRTYVFNVQDQALVQSMEALLWQEDIPHDGPIRLLGQEAGFETNRSKLERMS